MILMVLTYTLTFIFLLMLISIQKNKRIGQTVREEGLKTHYKKNNTPIFGGVAFVVSYVIIFSYLLYIGVFDFLNYLLIVFPMSAYFSLGLIDDLLILKRKNNSGIKANMKLFIQIIIAVIYFVIYLLFDFNTTINLLFFTVDLKFIYGIFILLAFSTFTNATNLTDGADGLLTSTFSIILIGLFYISKNAIASTIIPIIFAGLSAFLYFNLPKAKIFMGDCGSLAIGSIFVSLCILMKQEIYLLFFGFIYLIEVISVVIQVMYFKLTKGKRFFKMAPLHHHFEIVLGSEIKTLILFVLFAIVNVLLVLFI